MPTRGERSEVRLTRWPHKGVLIISALAVVLAGGAGLTAGILLRGPDERTLTNSLREVEVTAEVEAREAMLDPFESTLTAGSTTILPAFLPAGVAVPVVTASPKKVGDPVASGDLLAAVGERPVFALTLAVPMYRDLQMGAIGVDVQSLNQALADLDIFSGPVSDRYTDRTRLAVKALYERSGYSAAGTLGGESLPITEILDLPDQPVTVTQKAAVNSVLSEGALLTMQTDPNQLIVRVDTLSKSALTIGGQATITGQGTDTTRPGTIATISEFQDVAPADGADPTAPPTSAAFPGFDVGVAIDFGDGGNPWPTGSVLVVQFAIDGEPSPAVPLTAIRESGGETYVFARREAEFVRVPVEVTGESDGWALIAASAELSIGDVIRIDQ